jgi:hypothetical protein
MLSEWAVIHRSATNMLAFAEECIEFVLSLPPSIEIEDQLGEVSSVPLTGHQRVATGCSLVTFATLATCHDPPLLAVYGDEPSAIPEESEAISTATPNNSKTVFSQ